MHIYMQITGVCFNKSALLSRARDMSEINFHKTNIESILNYHLVFKYFIMTNYDAFRN